MNVFVGIIIGIVVVIILFYIVGVAFIGAETAHIANQLSGDQKCNPGNHRIVKYLPGDSYTQANKWCNSQPLRQGESMNLIPCTHNGVKKYLCTIG